MFIWLFQQYSLEILLDHWTTKIQCSSTHTLTLESSWFLCDLFGYILNLPFNYCYVTYFLILDFITIILTIWANYFFGACYNPGSQWENYSHYFPKGPSLTFTKIHSYNGQGQDPICIHSCIRITKQINCIQQNPVIRIFYTEKTLNFSNSYRNKTLFFTWKHFVLRNFTTCRDLTEATCDSNSWRMGSTLIAPYYWMVLNSLGKGYFGDWVSLTWYSNSLLGGSQLVSVVNNHGECFRPLRIAWWDPFFTWPLIWLK